MVVLCSCLLLACQSELPVHTTAAYEGLAESFQGDFYIGTALNAGQIRQQDPAVDSLIQTHFNAIVAENCMKAERIHPQPGVYYWEVADAFVDYGQAHNMHITGHTLAWHSQTPAWYFQDEQGNDLSREAMIARLREHITTIMQRYQGKVKGWDVVNEAVLDNGEMRPSKFYQLIGPDWVEIAFQIAAAADPSAELYYNDYNLSNPQKAKAVYELVKAMQAKGIRVDGIGMQGHVNVDSPDLRDFEQSLLLFSKLGQVMITELDVTVLPWPTDRVTADVSESAAYQEAMNPYPNGLSVEMAQALDDRFVALFALFLKHRDKITRVTTWGVNDAQTWRNNWPIRGRSDYPLLFNRDNSPKSAVEQIIQLKKAHPQP